MTDSRHESMETKEPPLGRSASASINIVLTGYMGTGKSSVAREVARLLGRPFVDMDERIEERAGMTIPDIFRRQGEAAFRELERAICRELAAQQGLVIATGGGALVDAENRRAMMRNGLVICLDCDVEELLHRLRGDEGRPMLWSEDSAVGSEQKLRALWAARRPAYAEVPHHIDTSYRSLKQVVAEVLALVSAQPTTWEVQTPTGSYPVQLVPGGLAHLGALLKVRGVGGNLVAVSDEHVWALYSETIEAGLQASALNVTPVVLPAGERHKNLDTVRALYDRFVEAGLDRGAAVLAVGGGVITDMAGFAAATYMRGVPLVQVPTTLLGMIDASVGGKVAVDHPAGKNLIGAFVRPLLVMLDPTMLHTLPEPEYRAGLAEVIKAGIIGDADLFAALEGLEGNKPSADLLRWMVERALQVKIDVVEEDPYERGRRMVLNLGHTFAHAFEVLSEYELSHGLAVSIGMAAAARLAQIRGLCSAETAGRIIATLERHALPTHYGEASPQEVYEAMRRDKKSRGGTLRFILPRKIGDVIIDAEVRPEEVLQALEWIRP
ncbi:MAG: 3-dehydroquinate synthase [Chloroflexi bacterium]|nr:3-dehydroquinate synthase [Chloroflexota bacterium]